jgi:hypothetical protein
MRSMSGPWISICVVEPGASVRLPATFSVPMELPGARVPPDRTETPGRLPVPPSVPPEATVTPEELAMEPFTERRPAFTKVAPV